MLFFVMYKMEKLPICFMRGDIILKIKKLENITIQEFQNEAVIRVENAPNAVWKDGKWFMENGTIYDLGEDGISRTMRFKNQFIPYGQSPETIQKGA